LATSSVSIDERTEQGFAPAVTPGSLVLAVAIPLLFLHVHYQPGFDVHVGSATATAYLSDFAVLAVVLVALWSGIRDGFAPLARGRWLWLAIGLFFVWAFFEVGYGRARTSGYPWTTHGVSAAKFAEYALLAPALPLLIRRARDLVLPLWSLVLWCTFATLVGVLQFFDVRIFLWALAWNREASFLGDSDFAALAGATLLAGIVALAVPGLRLGRLVAIAGTVSGAIGVVLAGSLASILGLFLALVAYAIVLVVRGDVSPARLAAVGAIGLVVAAGAAAIRGNDLRSFGRFLGADVGQHQTQQRHVQTYAHHTLLAWLGFQIWKGHPLLGVGWRGDEDPVNFVPYLAAAHRRFPGESPLSFPSSAPDRRYGIQNIWIEALADLGVVGFALWLGTFAVAVWLSATTAVRLGPATAFIGLGWTLLVVGLFLAQDFVAGIPLDAVTWLGLGLAGTLPAAKAASVPA